MMQPDRLSPREVADRLPVGEKHVRRLLRAGKLKGEQEAKGKRWWILDRDVDAYLASRP